MDMFTEMDNRQDAVAHALEVENQLLKAQLTTLTSSMKMMKIENSQLQGQREGFLRERDELCKQVENLSGNKRSTEEFNDRIVLLEAEVERQGVHIQGLVATLEGTKREAKQFEEAAKASTLSYKEAVQSIKMLKGNLHEMVTCLSSVTRSLLPSYEQPTPNDQEVVQHLEEGFDFLNEVLKAKADATAMVRERMKSELMEYKTKASIATHKEEVLQQSLGMQEENSEKQQKLHAKELLECNRKHDKAVADLNSIILQKDNGIQNLSRELEISKLEQISLEQTVSEQAELITKCDTRLKQEAGARSHLQKVLKEEQRNRFKATKQVEELKLKMKLGSGHGYTLKEEELVLMVSQLKDAQGALEVENCLLRDKLTESILPIVSGREQAPQTLADDVDVAINESNGDIALTEAILLRNLTNKSNRN
eukprot:TRINITY_DN3493_c0_g1_i1.p1 TRINITY_DN3493_c0_g1~~TRINITY_DN3493_c0_g1_i1.p1  ORF type:complete len:424 (+),score=115.74 TRINITY_DN3493_c0_g1_i1:1200-2471(+)